MHTYVYPVFGTLPVQAVNARPGRPVVDDKSETASRVRGRNRIRPRLDAGARLPRGRERGEMARASRRTVAEENQCPAVEHRAALPYHERPRFMAELHRQHGVAARSLEFVIRTAARTGVVIGATAGNRSGAPPVGHSRQPNDGRWGGNTACPQQNRSRDPAVIV